MVKRYCVWRKLEEVEVNMILMFDIVFIFLIFFIVMVMFIWEQGFDVMKFDDIDELQNLE